MRSPGLLSHLPCTCILWHVFQCNTSRCRRGIKPPIQIRHRLRLTTTTPARIHCGGHEERSASNLLHHKLFQNNTQKCYFWLNVTALLIWSLWVLQIFISQKGKKKKKREGEKNNPSVKITRNWQRLTRVRQGKNNIKATTAAAQIFISVTFFLEVRVNKTSRRGIIFCIVKHITPGLTVLLLEHRT